jgi:hypothetical protein
MTKRTRYRLPAPIAYDQGQIWRDRLHITLITLAACVIFVTLLLLVWRYQPTTDFRPPTTTQENQP